MTELEYNSAYPYHFTSSVSVMNPREEKRTSFYRNSTMNRSKTRERVLTVTVSRKGLERNDTTKKSTNKLKLEYSLSTVGDFPPTNDLSIQNQSNISINQQNNESEKAKKEKKVQIQVNDSESSNFEEEEEYLYEEEYEINVEEEEESNEMEENLINKEIEEEEEESWQMDNQMYDNEENNEEEDIINLYRENSKEKSDSESHDYENGDLASYDSEEESSKVIQEENDSYEEENYQNEQEDKKIVEIHENDDELEENRENDKYLEENRENEGEIEEICEEDKKLEENLKKKENIEKEPKSRLKIHSKVGSTLLLSRSSIRNDSDNRKSSVKGKSGRRPSQRPIFKHRNQMRTQISETCDDLEENEIKKSPQKKNNVKKPVGHVSFIEMSPKRKKKAEVDISKPIDFSFRKPMKPPQEIEVFSHIDDDDDDNEVYQKRVDRSTFYDRSYVPEDEKTKNASVQTISHQKMHTKSRVSSIIKSCLIMDENSPTKCSKSIGSPKNSFTIEEIQSERARRLQIASTTPLKEKPQQKDECEQTIKSPGHSSKKSYSSPFETLVSKVNVRAPLAPSPDNDSFEVRRTKKEKQKSFIPRRPKSKMQIISSPPAQRTNNFVASPQPMRLSELSDDDDDNYERPQKAKPMSNDFSNAQVFAPGYLKSLIDKDDSYFSRSEYSDDDFLKSESSSVNESTRHTELKIPDKIQSIDDSLDSFLMVEEAMKKNSSISDVEDKKAKSGSQLTFIPIERQKPVKKEKPVRKYVTPNISRILKMIRTRVPGGPEFREISISLTKYKHEHLVILVTPPLNTLEGVYTLDEESQKLNKVWGESKSEINASEITMYMRYNNEVKDFDEVQASKLTQDTDVISIS